MNIYMPIYMHIVTYVCMHARMVGWMDSCMHMHMYMDMQMHMYMYRCMYMDVYMFMCIYLLICRCMCKYACLCMCVNLYIHISVYGHLVAPAERMQARSTTLSAKSTNPGFRQVCSSDAPQWSGGRRRSTGHRSGGRGQQIRLNWTFLFRVGLGLGVYVGLWLLLWPYTLHWRVWPGIFVRRGKRLLPQS